LPTACACYFRVKRNIDYAKSASVKRIAEIRGVADDGFIRRKKEGVMRKIRVTRLLLATVLVVALCPAMAMAMPDGVDQAGNPTAKTMVAQATKATKNLKQAGYSFDLKKNKSTSIKYYMRGAKNVAYNVKVSGFKTQNAGSGMKKTTFTLTYSLKNLTAKQRKAILKSFHKGYSGEDVFGMYSFTLVDYNTGMSLEDPNNEFGVAVKKLKNKTTYTKKYRDSDGLWFRMPKTWTVKLAVTYPSSYKGMCLGVIGSSASYGKLVDDSHKFFAGGKSIYQTKLYKTDRKNAHFMRIK